MIDALFGSKSRVKLLHLFLNNPGRSFYVREITRKTEEQVNSVRRELANLLNIGIIKGETQNNKLYYEVNQDYGYYLPFRQIFTDEISASKKSASGKTLPHLNGKLNWASRVKELGDVRLFVLAGKLVRGSLSQVDLMIAGNVNKTKLKKLVKELEEEEGSEINYSVLSYEDFYYRLSIRDRFVADLINNKHSVIIDTEGIL
jgi:predicted transcriptional regulator